MKNKIKYMIGILIMLVVFCIPSINAAASLNVSSASVYVGDTITVSATVSSVASWGMRISASGPVSFVSGSNSDANATDDAKNGSRTITAVYKATGTGTINFSLSGDTTTEDGVNTNISASKAVTVSEKPAPPPVVDPPTNNNNTGNTGNTNNNTTTKSSNNYLRTLQVNAEGLSPRFVKTTQNYAITVAENVTSINVTALPEDGKSKVYISGNTNLQMGNNTVTITVTAENGNKRYYKITVTKVTDPAKSNAFLDNLIIQGVELNPAFQSETLEYNLGKVAADFNSFTILAFAKDENAKVEIIGNDELKVGTNKIVIKVTAPDNNTVKEYILNYEKEEQTIITEDNDALKEVNKSNDNFFKKSWRVIKANSLIILMFIFILVEFAQILYLYLKQNKKPKMLPVSTKQKRVRRTAMELKSDKFGGLSEENEVIEGLKENPKVELKSRVNHSDKQNKVDE